jgi:hypothetical protein
MKDIVITLPRIEPVPTRPTTSNQIDGIAIHHSADLGNPQTWSVYHTTPPADGGPSWGPANTIGYHAAVMRDGSSYKCAYDRDITPGVAGHNHHLIHIVLQGNLAKQPPTAEQIRELLKVIPQYQAAYAVPIDRVRTHGEWQDDPKWATACPGIPDLGKHIRFMLTVGL